MDKSTLVVRSIWRWLPLLNQPLEMMTMKTLLTTCHSRTAVQAALRYTGGDEISDVQGALTCIQPDGSMSDGQVYIGLVEHLEVAAISEPAIGNEEEKDPFDDLPFAAVQAALRSTCHVA